MVVRQILENLRVGRVVSGAASLFGSRARGGAPITLDKQTRRGGIGLEMLKVSIGPASAREPRVGSLSIRRGQAAERLRRRWVDDQAWPVRSMSTRAETSGISMPRNTSGRPVAHERVGEGRCGRQGERARRRTAAARGAPAPLRLLLAETGRNGSAARVRLADVGGLEARARGVQQGGGAEASNRCAGSASSGTYAAGSAESAGATALEQGLDVGGDDAALGEQVGQGAGDQPAGQVERPLGDRADPPGSPRAPRGR